MSQLDQKSEAWSALFSEPMSDLVKRYTASVFFDKRLWQADIAGSLAHAGMLARQGVISATDLADIRRGLEQIGGEGDHRYVLMCLVALQDEGLTVFPTHRLVTDLKGDDEPTHPEKPR